MNFTFTGTRRTEKGPGPFFAFSLRGRRRFLGADELARGTRPGATARWPGCRLPRLPACEGLPPLHPAACRGLVSVCRFPACPPPAGRHPDWGVAAFHPAACRGLVSVVRFPGLALPLPFLAQSFLGVNPGNLRNLRPLAVSAVRFSLYILHSSLCTLKMSVCTFNHTKEGHLCAS